MSGKETKPMMRKIYKQLADFMLDYSGAKNYQHWSPVFKENNNYDPNNPRRATNYFVKLPVSISQLT